MDFIVREMTAAEYPLLEDFLYEAIFVREGETKPPRDVIYLPDLWLYVDGFGAGRADRAVAALSGGRIVGAAWARIMDDYGHVDDETPSLAISLYPGFRGRGIGAALMRALLEELKHAGFVRASLSVQKDNYALKLYRRLGFEVLRENEEDYIMVREL